MPCERGLGRGFWIGVGLWSGLSCALVRGQEAEAPWMFQPVVRPEVPGTSLPVNNPIDAFLNHALEAEGIAPAPEADRRTLMRRLSFDLTGLPPDIVDVEAFEQDTRPGAYERLVDRLLASPHYGERWGRHWLDVVRFAETHGYERDDPKPNAWKYRDYVIRSLNADKPYDRFVTEQLAGDELPDANNETLIATALHRLGLVDDEPADPVMDRFDQLDDVVKTVSTTFLGITLHCARCHDHKFDPISQADYYRMLAFFEPSKPFVRDSVESISLVLSPPEEQRRVDDLNRAVARRVAWLRERIGTLGDGQPALKEHLEKEAAKLESLRPGSLSLTLGLTDRAAMAEPTRLLTRGDAHKPGQPVEPGVPAALGDTLPPIESPNGRTTGRRTALARWVTRAQNPLTPRVIVNRLWHYHFGKGIVSTPSDLGAMGEVPTNPELIDWLASEFVEGGWSLKSMHRLIVTSAAYRRGNLLDERAQRLDPENRLIWRRAPRRLEAEPIRDTILAVSGSLNRAMGGESVCPPINAAVLAGQSRPGSGWKSSSPREAARRSIYVLVKRTLALPELEVLDAPDTNDPCPARATTTTSLQALTLLNSAFTHEQAAAFAQRLRRSAGFDPRALVTLAYRLALARPPSEAECEQACAFLERQSEHISARPNPDDRADVGFEALKSFCLVLLNSNEFVTVD